MVLIVYGKRELIQRNFMVMSEEHMKQLIFAGRPELTSFEIFWSDDEELIERKIKENKFAVLICIVEKLDFRKTQVIDNLCSHYKKIYTYIIYPFLDCEIMRFAEKCGYAGIFEQDNFNPQSLIYIIRRDIYKDIKNLNSDLAEGELLVGERSFLQHTFWRNTIFLDRWFDERELIKKGKELGLSLELTDKYMEVLMRVCYENRMLSVLDIFDRTKEFFSCLDEYEIIEVAPDKICLIIKIDKETVESVNHKLEQYLTLCKKKNFFWTAYSSDITFIYMLREKYIDLWGMDAQNIVPQHGLFRLTDTPFSKRTSMIEGRDWIQFFAEGNTQKIWEEIEKFMDKLILQGGLTADNLQSIVQRMVMAFYGSMEMRRIPVDEIVITDGYLEKCHNAETSIEGLKSLYLFLEQYNADVIDRLQHEKFLSGQITKFISENVENDISRDLIAEHFFMSRDYISHVFKTETGKSLTEVINEEKIKQAKKYLILSGMSVSEISLKIGITNFSYFTRLFKKETGYTPQEFRKKCLNK